MVRNENILQELKEISSAVATISSRNVYTIPTGYFEALADNLLAGVQMANRPACPLPYSVPANYFDGLAGKVMEKIRLKEEAEAKSCQEEVAAIAPLLATVGKITPYKTPSNYFENLPANILHGIPKQSSGDKLPDVFEELLQIAPLLNTIPKKTPYQAPDGYFEGVLGFVVNNNLNKVTSTTCNDVFEEIEQIAPLLNTIGKTGPYSLPENYFEQFAAGMLAQTAAAKVVDIRRPKTPWMVWLAAACITAIVLTGGFKYWQGAGKQQPQADINKSLAGVSDEEISNYLGTMPSPGIETIPSSVIDELGPQVEPAIQNMSTEEINDYLEKNSDPGEKSRKDI